jgi:hypothetical protein
MEEKSFLSSRESAGNCTSKAIDGSLKSELPPMYGHSRSGEAILVELVSASEDVKNENGKIWDEPNLNTNGTNDIVDKQAVRSELQNIAKEFPSCAKYLLKELDKRRWVFANSSAIFCLSRVFIIFSEFLKLIEY